jgi:hypothetical protein
LVLLAFLFGLEGFFSASLSVAETNLGLDEDDEETDLDLERLDAEDDRDLAAATGLPAGEADRREAVLELFDIFADNGAITTDTFNGFN